MTPQQIADQLKAMENEYKAGDIGIWNYKEPLKKLFDLAWQVANEHAELAKRVEELEAKQPKGE